MYLMSLKCIKNVKIQQSPTKTPMLTDFPGKENSLKKYH